jgi:hypothetical protein
MLSFFCHTTPRTRAPIIVRENLAWEPVVAGRRGNAYAMVRMTTVAGVPPFHSGATHAERQGSPAAGSGSEARADAGSSQVQPHVRPGHRRMALTISPPRRRQY